MPISYTQELLKTSQTPIVLKAFATWCPHCNTMKPVFEKLEQELKDHYTCAEFDVDKSPDLTKIWNVTQLPTFIFIKDQKEAGRTVGELSEEELKKLAQKYLGA